MELTNEVLKTIKDKNIKPIPKWEFLLKGYVIMLVSIMNILFGSIGFAIILYLINSNDLFNDPSLHVDNLQGVFLLIPFVWIILTVVFVVIAIYNFKKSEEGYRYNVFRILGISIVASLILGLGINISGFAGQMNSAFGQHIPFYNNVFDLRSKVWMRPERGYISGTIVNYSASNSTVSIEDLNGKNWEIKINEANIKPSVEIQVGEKVKILGKQLTDNAFEAIEVRPWEGSGKNLQENHSN